MVCVPRHNTCCLHRMKSLGWQKKGQKWHDTDKHSRTRVGARLLPPEGAAVELVAQEMVIGSGTLQRWREYVQSRPAPWRAWTAAARLQAAVTTAAVLPVTGKSAWCREQGIYIGELNNWCASATAALADPQDACASPQATLQDRKRIKALECDCVIKAYSGCDDIQRLVA